METSKPCWRRFERIPFRLAMPISDSHSPMLVRGQ
jgi:hypothetical protein